MRKRFLSMLLAACFIVSLLPTFALADGSEFMDMPVDYSTTALNAAVSNGLLKGTDGKILPNDSLTRAQMAAIIVRAFGATETAGLNGYTDVDSTAWYVAELGSAVKMKVLQGDGATMRPDAPISRQEVFAVVARALKLEDGTTADLASFADKDSVAKWAVGTTAAMVNAGYVHGADGKLNPTANITRKDFAVLMDNLVKTYVPAAGTVTSVAEGNVMVKVPGVTLKDLTVTGNLIIGDGVGDGEVTLENVKVTGAMIIRGGGVNSIIIKGDSSVGKVVITKVDGKVRVVAEDGTEIPVVIVEDGKDDVIVEGKVAKLEVQASDVPVVVQNATIEEVTVTADKASVTVDKDSSVKTVTATGEAPKLTVAGKVETLTATEKAKGAAIEVAKGGTVTNAEVAAEGAAITGEGKVTNADVSGDNVNVSTPGTKVTAAEGTSGVKAGDKDVKPGESSTTEGGTPSSGGGTTGGGSVTPAYPKTTSVASIAIPATGALAITQSQTAANAYEIALSGIVPMYTKDSTSDVGKLFGTQPDGQYYAVLQFAGAIPAGESGIVQTNPALELYDTEGDGDNITSSSGVYTKTRDYTKSAAEDYCLLVGPGCGIVTVKVTQASTTTTYTIDCTGLTDGLSAPQPAKLHDTRTAGAIADDRLVNDYTVTSSKTAPATYKVAVSASDLEYHQNGDTTPKMGYWIGFALEAPEGAEKMKASFKSDKEDLTFENVDPSALETNVVGDKPGVAFYANLADPSPKTWAMVQWLNSNKTPISAPITYHMDLSGVSLAATDADALKAAVKADIPTVKLAGDITLTETLTIPTDTNVTLDLNGKTLKGQVISEGSLTITDSTASNVPTVSESDSYAVTYNSGKITNTDTTCIAQSGGSITLQNGQIESTKNIGIIAVGDKTGSYKTSSTVNVKGGYVLAQEYGASAQGNGAVLNVNGGVIVAKDNAAIAGNGTYTESEKLGKTEINVSGGTAISHIQSAGYIACGIYHPQSGSLTITGGKIVADGGVGILMRGGEMTMSGGEIIATGTAQGKVGDSTTIQNCYGVQIDGTSNYYDYKNCSVSIIGGTVTANADTLNVVKNQDSSKMTITGGTFSNDPTKYLSSNYTATQNDNGIWTVAKNGGSDE